ncbi:MAG: sigma-70 family RNA polymerase sigma factor [Deltaproteobacteria bacterium]|nr:sigma-70 family RNA polymerase sigma factor [Deltaproteobacteria bacterium]
MGRYIPQNQNDHFQAYVSEVQSAPRLSREDELELASRYRDGDSDAGERLVAAHLRFVISMARKYRGYRVPFADLVGEGSLGVLEALRRFEPERGLRFLTYARHWIRAYMLAFVLKQWSIVDMGTSATQSKLFFKLQSEHARLVAELGGEDPAIAGVLARQFGTTESHVEHTLARLRGRDASLDAPLKSDGATTFGELLPAASDSQEERALAAERQALVQEAVARIWDRLGEREQTIVRERLLGGDDAKSLAQLGRDMGVTRERVRQIESSIKDSIRRELERLYGDSQSPYQYHSAA